MVSKGLMPYPGRCCTQKVELRHCDRLPGYRGFSCQMVGPRFQKQVMKAIL